MGLGGLHSIIFVFIDFEGKAVLNVDFNLGTPRAGIVRLSSESDYIESISRKNGWPYFDDGALLTDLLLRRLIRGKKFDTYLILEAKNIWVDMNSEEKEGWKKDLSSIFGESAAQEWVDFLNSSSNSRTPEWGRLRMKMVAHYFKIRPCRFVIGILDRLFFSRSPRRREINFAGAYPIGTTVAIIGTDGTGKTTLANGTFRQLQKFGLESEMLYFGRVKGGVSGIEKFKKLFGQIFIKNISKTNNSIPSIPRPMSLAEKFVRWIASVFYCIDYFVRFIILLLPPLMKRKVIILDRYVYDLYIMPASSHFAAWVIEKVLPRPNLVCFLDTEIERIMERRTERTMLEAKYQQETLHRICLRNTKNKPFLAISNKLTAEENIHQLVRASIMLAFRREIRNNTVVNMTLDDVCGKLK